MKTKMINGQRFFIDGNKNRWSAKYYTEGEANAWSHTLKNCHDCVDTVLSENCSNLEDCTRCRFCKNSTKLIGCDHCENLDDCSFCANLTKGTGLRDVTEPFKFIPNTVL